jgi:hypothetical protein
MIKRYDVIANRYTINHLIRLCVSFKRCFGKANIGENIAKLEKAKVTLGFKLIDYIRVNVKSVFKNVKVQNQRQ